jgi:hypothetical protein
MRPSKSPVRAALNLFRRPPLRTLPFPRRGFGGDHQVPNPLRRFGEQFVHGKNIGSGGSPELTSF